MTRRAGAVRVGPETIDRKVWLIYDAERNCYRGHSDGGHEYRSFFHATKKKALGGCFGSHQYPVRVHVRIVPIREVREAPRRGRAK